MSEEMAENGIPSEAVNGDCGASTALHLTQVEIEFEDEGKQAIEVDEMCKNAIAILNQEEKDENHEEHDSETAEETLNEEEKPSAENDEVNDDTEKNLDDVEQNGVSQESDQAVKTERKTSPPASGNEEGENDRRRSVRRTRPNRSFRNFDLSSDSDEAKPQHKRGRMDDDEYVPTTDGPSRVRKASSTTDTPKKKKTKPSKASTASEPARKKKTKSTASEDEPLQASSILPVQIQKILGEVTITHNQSLTPGWKISNVESIPREEHEKVEEKPKPPPENITLSENQKSRAVKILENSLNSTVDMGDTITSEANQLLTSKVSVEDITDLRSLQSSLNEAFDVLKRAKERAEDIAEQLRVQFSSYMIKNNMNDMIEFDQPVQRKLRRIEVSSCPDPYEGQSDSDCEIIESGTSVPNKAKSLAGSELSILRKVERNGITWKTAKGAKKSKIGSYQAAPTQQSIQLPGQKPLFINKSIQIKKVPTKSFKNAFFCRDGRTLKPPDYERNPQWELSRIKRLHKRTLVLGWLDLAGGHEDKFISILKKLEDAASINNKRRQDSCSDLGESCSESEEDDFLGDYKKERILQYISNHSDYRLLNKCPDSLMKISLLRVNESLNMCHLKESLIPLSDINIINKTKPEEEYSPSVACVNKSMSVTKEMNLEGLCEKGKEPTDARFSSNLNVSTVNNLEVSECKQFDDSAKCVDTILKDESMEIDDHAATIEKQSSDLKINLETKEALDEALKQEVAEVTLENKNMMQTEDLSFQDKEKVSIDVNGSPAESQNVDRCDVNIQIQNDGVNDDLQKEVDDIINNLQGKIRSCDEIKIADELDDSSLQKKDENCDESNDNNDLREKSKQDNVADVSDQIQDSDASCDGNEDGFNDLLEEDKSCDDANNVDLEKKDKISDEACKPRNETSDVNSLQGEEKLSDEINDSSNANKLFDEVCKPCDETSVVVNSLQDNDKPCDEVNDSNNLVKDKLPDEACTPCNKDSDVVNSLQDNDKPCDEVNDGRKSLEKDKVSDEATDVAESPQEKEKTHDVLNDTEKNKTSDNVMKENQVGDINDVLSLLENIKSENMDETFDYEDNLIEDYNLCAEVPSEHVLDSLLVKREQLEDEDDNVEEHPLLLSPIYEKSTNVPEGNTPAKLRKAFKALLQSSSDSEGGTEKLVQRKKQRRKPSERKNKRVKACVKDYTYLLNDPKLKQNCSVNLLHLHPSILDAYSDHIAEVDEEQRMEIEIEKLTNLSTLNYATASRENKANNGKPRKKADSKADSAPNTSEQCVAPDLLSMLSVSMEEEEYLEADTLLEAQVECVIEEKQNPKSLEELENEFKLKSNKVARDLLAGSSSEEFSESDVPEIDGVPSPIKKTKKSKRAKVSPPSETVEDPNVVPEVSSLEEMPAVLPQEDVPAVLPQEDVPVIEEENKSEDRPIPVNKVDNQLLKDVSMLLKETGTSVDPEEAAELKKWKKMKIKANHLQELKLKSRGDEKFLPEVELTKLKELLESANNAKLENPYINKLMKETKKKSAVKNDLNPETSTAASRRNLLVPDIIDLSDSDEEERASTRLGMSEAMVAEMLMKGRKNIRKVKAINALVDATKMAAKDEEDRLQRLHYRKSELAKLKETVAPVNGKKKIPKNLILDLDVSTRQPIIYLHPALAKIMKEHQIEGVNFMWDSCFESVAMTNNGVQGGGCILAHCMGLGKTLQVVGLIHAILTCPQLPVQTVLICCPLSTVLNWVEEFCKWLRNIDKKKQIKIYEMSKFKKSYARGFLLEEWHKTGGVFIMGYEMFRHLTSLSLDKPGIKPRDLVKIKRTLLQPGPDVVVCDEGHLLKNDNTALAKAMHRIKTRRRILLTGTPLQNNLKEYYCMVNFVKPNLLGTQKEYYNRFENPITNGQHRDSNLHDIKIMKKRSHVLHKMLEGCVHRKEVSVLSPFLPPKQEYVLLITLTECQVNLYKHYLENYARNMKNSRGVSLLKDYHSLQKIWTHPRVLQEFYLKTRDSKLKSDQNKGGGKSFFSKIKKESELDGVCYNEELMQELEEVAAESATINEQWWLPYAEELLDTSAASNKLTVVFDILDECLLVDDKMIIFCTSLFTLDTLEYFLGKNKGWKLGENYYRLDGSTSLELRQKCCRHFNSESNNTISLFLISARAGGLGLNMVAANRVVIMDVSWNPSHDIQSIFRIYRFGQKKHCYIYRLVSVGTMEEKMYERSVTKQAIACRVVDEQQIDRHYNTTELSELYNFTEMNISERALPNLPADPVLAAVLARDHGAEGAAAVWSVHQHDSLLRDLHEEQLDESERMMAWAEYEQEKLKANKSAANASAASTSATQAKIPKYMPGINKATKNAIIPKRSKKDSQQLNFNSEVAYPVGPIINNISLSNHTYFNSNTDPALPFHVRKIMDHISPYPMMTIDATDGNASSNNSQDSVEHMPAKKNRTMYKQILENTMASSPYQQIASTSTALYLQRGNSPSLPYQQMVNAPNSPYQQMTNSPGSPYEQIANSPYQQMVNSPSAAYQRMSDSPYQDVVYSSYQEMDQYQEVAEYDNELEPVYEEMDEQAYQEAGPCGSDEGSNVFMNVQISNVMGCADAETQWVVSKPKAKPKSKPPTKSRRRRKAVKKRRTSVNKAVVTAVESDSDSCVILDTPEEALLPVHSISSVNQQISAVQKGTARKSTTYDSSVIVETSAAAILRNTAKNTAVRNIATKSGNIIKNVAAVIETAARPTSIVKNTAVVRNIAAASQSRAVNTAAVTETSVRPTSIFRNTAFVNNIVTASRSRPMNTSSVIETTPRPISIIKNTAVVKNIATTTRNRTANTAAVVESAARPTSIVKNTAAMNAVVTRTSRNKNNLVEKESSGTNSKNKKAAEKKTDTKSNKRKKPCPKSQRAAIPDQVILDSSDSDDMFTSNPPSSQADATDDIIELD